MNFGALKTARGRLQYSELQQSSLEWTMEVAIVLAVLKSRQDTAKFTNVRIAGFGQCRYLFRESEMFVKDKTQVTSRVSGIESAILYLNVNDHYRDLEKAHLCV